MCAYLAKLALLDLKVHFAEFVAIERAPPHFQLEIHDVLHGGARDREHDAPHRNPTLLALAVGNHFSDLHVAVKR